MDQLLYASEVVVNGLMAGVMYALVALGFVLIYKASGVFNYAQGVLALFAAMTLVGIQNGQVPFAHLINAAFGLGDPDRLAVFTDRVIDIRRQQLISRQLLASAADRAVHDETLVQAHQVADEGALQQVVADGDTWCLQAGMVDGVVDEGRVHDDIAVVGQVQVRLTGLQVFQAGVADAVTGMLDGAINIGFDLFLQLGNRIDAGELAAQPRGDQRLEQPA